VKRFQATDGVKIAQNGNDVTASPAIRAPTLIRQPIPCWLKPTSARLTEQTRYLAGARQPARRGGSQDIEEGRAGQPNLRLHPERPCAIGGHSGRLAEAGRPHCAIRRPIALAENHSGDQRRNATG
jgi:hypothetical protein